MAQTITSGDMAIERAREALVKGGWGFVVVIGAKQVGTAWHVTFDTISAKLLVEVRAYDGTIREVKQLEK